MLPLPVGSLAWIMRLFLGGDAMLGRGVDTRLAEAGAATGLGELRPLLAGKDALFVNLECAVAGPAARYRGPAKAFLFRARPAALQALTHVGVDLVSMANNHAMDAGATGLDETLAHLTAAGIVAVGAGEDADAAWTPARLERAGARLGVIAACDHQADFAAGRDRPGIAYLDVAGVERLVGSVTELSGRVDHVVVALHWQANWVRHITRDTRALARRLLAAGARVVWGHSPHHLQGVECGRSAAVVYGSGSLIDDYALEPEFRNDRQLLYELELEPGRVAAVRAHPIELRYARTVPAQGEARAWIGERFTAACAELGSVVRVAAGGALEVMPGGPG